MVDFGACTKGLSEKRGRKGGKMYIKNIYIYIYLYTCFYMRIIYLYPNYSDVRGRHPSYGSFAMEIPFLREIQVGELL